ncbi:hypothetical protein VTO42DRAFT_5436 [Malbranchea cinnamomea]
MDHEDSFCSSVCFYFLLQAIFLPSSARSGVVSFLTSPVWNLTSANPLGVEGAYSLAFSHSHLRWALFGIRTSFLELSLSLFTVHVSEEKRPVPPVTCDVCLRLPYMNGIYHANLAGYEHAINDNGNQFLKRPAGVTARCIHICPPKEHPLTTINRQEKQRYARKLEGTKNKTTANMQLVIHTVSK